MDGMEKMVQRIVEDGQKEVDEILTQAQAEAAEVTRQYAVQAEKLQADYLSRGEKAAAEREERLNGLARMEGKKVLLGAKQELIGRAFEMAVEQLAALPKGEYTNLLIHLTVQAAVSGQEELVFSPADREKFGQEVVKRANQQLSKEKRTGNLRLSEATYPIRGGLFLRDEDGDTDCSLETLVHLQRNVLTPTVSTLLFD